MVFKKLFGREEEEPAYDPTNLQLQDLDVGFMVDYDLSTWEVMARYEYDWGDNYFTDELKIQASGKALYLHLEEDDELEVSISHKIKLSQVSQNIPDHFQDTDDAPRSLTYEGTTYTLEEEAQGLFRNVRREHWDEFISWEYTHPDGEQFLTLERWGEEEFELSHGHYVEPYQFSNILPA